MKVVLFIVTLWAQSPDGQDFHQTGESFERMDSLEQCLALRATYKQFDFPEKRPDLTFIRGLTYKTTRCVVLD